MRQFVGHVTNFAMGELDALPWDAFLDEFVTAIELREDLREIPRGG